MYKILLPLIMCLFVMKNGFGQTCGTHESRVIISIIPDDYPDETSWDLKDSNGNLIAYGDVQGASLCVNNSLCLIFTIYDAYGDGICCDYGNGSYEISFNGEVVKTGGNFTYFETFSFNCPPGYSCFNAISVSEGIYSAPNNNHWYEFTPAATGIYTISTCDNNTCDTKIWVYDYCSGQIVNQNTNVGTIYYDDNEGGCGLQANVTAYLELTKSYFIRIGSQNNSCSGAINWSLIFGGDILGCMNPEACNYAPFANVDDGSCIFDGNPGCSIGPDLTVLEDALRNSLDADIIFNNTDNCMINEGCLQGFGSRQIVRFTTHIKNIGDMDYFIGSPNSNPGQFTFDNCHNHSHYEGYAEYRLANSDNELLPIGFKNGFCVLDLECSDGGTPKYGCGNMGISNQCGDIYSSGLDCQWVDVTDLPVGDYTLAVTVNWDRSADALGNIEHNYDNNWAQVCFRLNRNSSGIHSVNLITPCSAYVDCLGIPYGNAKIDCMGNCNGTSLYGDLNVDGSQTTLDAQEYIDNIIDGGMDAMNCFDLYVNDSITVYDAALINNCVLYGIHTHPGGGTVHDHCNLPGGVTNPTHTVSLSILDVDFDNQTIDIGILNPLDHIVAYEFDMSGIMIEQVTNLVDVNQYPIEPDYFPGGTKVIGISLLDSAITKSNSDFQPLCRIKFSEITDDEICIANIVDIVNDQYYKVNSAIVNGCAALLTGHQTANFIRQMSIYPNPSSGQFSVQYQLVQDNNMELNVQNSLGQEVFSKMISNTGKGSIEINLSDEPNGVYYIQLNSEKGSITKRWIRSE